MSPIEFLNMYIFDILAFFQLEQSYQRAQTSAKATLVRDLESESDAGWLQKFNDNFLVLSHIHDNIFMKTRWAVFLHEIANTEREKQTDRQIKSIRDRGRRASRNFHGRR